MKFYGVDFAKKEDSFAMMEMEIEGAFKAPAPRDVKYKVLWNKTLGPVQ